MNRTDARLQLVEELANLVEALKDPETGDSMMESLDKSNQIAVTAVLGDSKTIIMIKQWKDEEIRNLTDEVEWAEYIDEN